MECNDSVYITKFSDQHPSTSANAGSVYSCWQYQLGLRQLSVTSPKVQHGEIESSCQSWKPCWNGASADQRNRHLVCAGGDQFANNLRVNLNLFAFGFVLKEIDSFSLITSFLAIHNCWLYFIVNWVENIFLHRWPFTCSHKFFTFKVPVKLIVVIENQ